MQYTFLDFTAFNDHLHKLKAITLRMLADTYRYMAVIHRSTVYEKFLLTRTQLHFREAEIAASYLDPCDETVLKLAMSQSAFCFEQLHSPEMALKHTAQAVIQAREAMPDYAAAD